MPRRYPYQPDGEDADVEQAGVPPRPWTETKVVGKPIPRIDAYERVSGTAVFPSDVTLPDMLYAAVLRCPHAHANVKRVDASAAGRMPGVRGIITGSTPGVALPWYPGPDGKVICPFAAQFVEVEVNTLTGETSVVRVVAAHDSGRVMNLLSYANQVFGGVTMGIGLALTEARILDRSRTGKMVNVNWHDYKVPTAMDVPADLTCVPVDLNDTQCNSAGAKGLGEPATIPTAAAVGNAVFHATGSRVTDAPMTPAQVLESLLRKALPAAACR